MHTPATLVTSITVLCIGASWSQPATVPISVVPKASYLTSGKLPVNMREYLWAVGNRLQAPGNERITLIGTFTTSQGSTPAQLVWELPGNVRLDRSATPNAPIIIPFGTTPVNSSVLSQADTAVAESLSADNAEWFLYSFLQGAGHRLLGVRVRTDNGTTPNYQGSLYDVFEFYGSVREANNAIRQKWFFFDTTTRLLAKAR